MGGMQCGRAGPGSGVRGVVSWWTFVPWPHGHHQALSPHSPGVGLTTPSSNGCGPSARVLWPYTLTFSAWNTASGGRQGWNRRKGYKCNYGSVNPTWPPELSVAQSPLILVRRFCRKLSWNDKWKMKMTLLGYIAALGMHEDGRVSAWSAASGFITVCFNGLKKAAALTYWNTYRFLWRWHLCGSCHTCEYEPLHPACCPPPPSNTPGHRTLSAWTLPLMD